MATKPAYQMVVESFVGVIKGQEVEYRKGEIVDGDDPAVRRWPVHFGPLVVRSYAGTERPIEQATAAPGEKRGA